ncbi:MAG TPA: allantoate amidohydrolase [Bryobacteraceae bacterium]|nr:allantoate amidohydrolase [Bryobacteraceae bacterium]
MRPYLAQAEHAMEWCRKLAAMSEEPGVTTRTFLSAPMHEVHAALGAWMERLGMRANVDAAGNLRAVYAGAGGDARRLVIGSHLDTVPRAGAFDGVLGVVLGLELIEALAGRRLPFAIEVIGFSEEEGVRFGVPFIGSRALLGSVDPELLARRDLSGVSVRDAIRAFGLDPARISEAALGDGAFAYFELHIEQGPVLDSLDQPVGIVAAIAGQSRIDVVFEGESNHAGATPMKLRRDALAGAAEWISSVEREAYGNDGLVATVGRLAVEPGATNIIPGTARLSLDVRHAEDDVRVQAVRDLMGVAREVAARRGLRVSFDDQFDQTATPMSPGLVEKLERAVAAAGYPVQKMVSGPGHDAMILAGVTDVAMLFVRSPGGVSHSPQEAVLAPDVAAAIDVGLRFLSECEANCA